MALELLGGPYTVFDPRDASAVSVASLAGKACFVEPRGIIFNASTERLLIQYDGAAYAIGLGRNASVMEAALAVVGGSALDPLVGRRTYAEVGGASAATLGCYERDPLTLVGNATIAMGETINESTSDSMRFIVLPDRVIRIYVSTVYAWDGAAWAVEYSLPISNCEYLSWGDEPDQVWLGNYDGDAVLYDLTAQSVVSTVSTGVAGIGLFYWRKHRVFVSLHGSGAGPYALQTRVWASTPLPSAVSVPTVDPALTAGRQSTITARVTGSDGEPCEGEVVGWTASQGTLGNTSSVTDEDGYATVTIVVPAGAAGSIDIDAEVHV